jgi:hypothetical protein
MSTPAWPQVGSSGLLYTIQVRLSWVPPAARRSPAPKHQDAATELLSAVLFVHTFTVLQQLLAGVCAPWSMLHADRETFCCTIKTACTHAVYCAVAAAAFTCCDAVVELGPRRQVAHGAAAGRLGEGAGDELHDGVVVLRQAAAQCQRRHPQPLRWQRLHRSCYAAITRLTLLPATAHQCLLH